MPLTSSLSLIDLVNRLRNNDNKVSYLNFYSLAGDDVTDDVLTQFIANFPNGTYPYLLRFQGPRESSSLSSSSSSITLERWEAFLHHIILVQKVTTWISLQDNLFCLRSTSFLANLFRQSNLSSNCSTTTVLKILDLSNNRILTR
jgi:hypothetical protein